MVQVVQHEDVKLRSDRRGFTPCHCGCQRAVCGQLILDSRRRYDLDAFEDGRDGDRHVSPKRSGRFGKGRRPVRLLADRAGFWPARVNPMRAAATVPLPNPPRTWCLPGLRRPEAMPFAPADRHRPGRSGAPMGATARAPSRRRERPCGAALKLWRTSSHNLGSARHSPRRFHRPPPNAP
jgi:hypothetical protein